MKNIPNKIYLNIDGTSVKDDVDFNDLRGVSWCADRINKTDIVYFRKKKAVIDNKKLLPCPFCGRKPKIATGWTELKNYGKTYGVTIACKNEKCDSKPHVTVFLAKENSFNIIAQLCLPAEARSKWNKRK